MMRFGDIDLAGKLNYAVGLVCLGSIGLVWSLSKVKWTNQEAWLHVGRLGHYYMDLRVHAVIRQILIGG